MKILNLAKVTLLLAGIMALGAVAPMTYAQAGGQDQANPPAQGQPGPGMHGHENPYAGLNLTDDQKEQIKKIHADAKAKADAVMADTSLSDQDKHTKLHEIHRAARMEADKVLTPEQRAQLKEKMKERREAKSNPS
jgi:periplasmic protein CpxP/Spy